MPTTCVYHKNTEKNAPLVPEPFFPVPVRHGHRILQSINLNDITNKALEHKLGFAHCSVIPDTVSKENGGRIRRETTSIRGAEDRRANPGKIIHEWSARQKVPAFWNAGTFPHNRTDIRE